MGLFKILSIKVLRPDDEFLMMKNEELEAAFGSPIPEEIALRASRYKNIHKCLELGTEYRLSDVNCPLPDDFFNINTDRPERDIEISVSAIVGQNGSGKSTLLELLVRLFNNAAFAFQNAYVSHPAIPLHFVEDVYAELTYQMPEGGIFQLEQKGTVLRCLDRGTEMWRYDNQQRQLISGADSIYNLNNRFFFTIVLNYSSYSYNLYNFKPEWHDLPQIEGVEYTDEDRCWLSAIFHKNDAYQTPVVLNPFRSFGEIDFNNEADLTRDRLFLLSVQNVDMLSVLMEGVKTHSVVFDTKLSLVEQPNKPFSSPLVLDQFVQLHSLKSRKDINENMEAFSRCQMLCELIIDAWGGTIEENLSEIVGEKLLAQDIRRALNYLAYKTIKATRNYAMYSSYRSCFFLPWDNSTEKLTENIEVARRRIPQLVKELWEDQTHVTLKIHKTLAFLKFRHYQLGMGNELGLGKHQVSAGRYNNIIESLYQQLGGDEQSIWKREYLLPAPCFDARLLLSEKKRDNNGNVILGEEVLTELNSRSSGEMQLLYSLSTVLYHLKNIDSNIVSGRNALRYPCINLIFDEIELYFHPNFQKDLLYDLLYAIRKMKYQGIQAINIIIATHSPYILSDFPKSNVLCLEKGKVYHDKEHQMNNTFSANVYDILHSRFFMNEFVGKFAVNKLDEIIDEVQVGDYITLEEYRQRLKKVELIGDVFVKEKLKEELIEKLGHQEKRLMVQEEINRLEHERDYWRRLLTEDIERREE